MVFSGQFWDVVKLHVCMLHVVWVYCMVVMVFVNPLLIVQDEQVSVKVVLADHNEFNFDKLTSSLPTGLKSIQLIVPGKQP